MSAAPGMSSTPSIRPISQSSWPGRTGANPTPQLPVTTVVTAVSAGRLQQGIPADLAVVVGVDVDEPGRDDLAGCVDGLGGVALQRRATRPTAPNLDDHAVFHGDVGVVSVHAGSIDDGATGDFEIEHDYSLGRAAGWLQ